MVVDVELKMKDEVDVDVDETDVCMMAVSAQISGRHVFVGEVLVTSRSSD